MADKDKQPAPQDSSVDVQVNDTSVPAQVAPARKPDANQVSVHETRVTVDTVITDPNDPLAVQVPEAGKGDASTPIARAWAKK